MKKFMQENAPTLSGLAMAIALFIWLVAAA